MIDYLGLIYVRQEMRRSIDGGSTSPAREALTSGFEGSGHTRKRMAGALRWTADRLEPSGRAQRGLSSEALR